MAKKIVQSIKKTAHQKQYHAFGFVQFKIILKLERQQSFT